MRASSLGDRVKVQNLALVYHGVTVEDGVFIGPNAILTNDRYPRAITAAGELARADDWERLGDPAAARLLHRRGRSRGGRDRRRPLRDRGRGIGRHPRRPRSRARGRAARRAGSAGCAPAAAAWRMRRGSPCAADHAGHARCAACGADYVIDGDRCVAG